ncbi:hypothetical protein [uncultured Duncaniella sp.]|nr:hypothetical protein [uncultured Duncaniella sp.]
MSLNRGAVAWPVNRVPAARRSRSSLCAVKALPTYSLSRSDNTTPSMRGL